MIYGVTEKDNKVVQDAVQFILKQINERPQVKECYRVGVKKADAHRPINSFSLIPTMQSRLLEMPRSCAL